MGLAPHMPNHEGYAIFHEKFGEGGIARGIAEGTLVSGLGVGLGSGVSRDSLILVTKGTCVSV